VIMSSPELSICLVNWNTREDLEQALASMLNSEPGVSVEVVVLDNASEDGSVEMVRERFPSVTVLEGEENVGFARGYNRAARGTEGRHLLMLNPDTIVRPGALERLVAFMDAHPRAGAAGPRLLNSDGSLQYSCRRFPRPLAAMFRNTVLGRLAPGNRYTRDYLMRDWDHGEAREVDWISGAAMCIRREAWEEVGGFDEGYFMYAEDVDWCLRAREGGWGIWYVPEATIVHRIGRSSDQRPTAMVVEFHRSMARFYREHYAREWPWGVRALPGMGIWMRCALVLVQSAFARARDWLRGSKGGKR
jgi:GT2 family glycosyltransferase